MPIKWRTGVQFDPHKPTPSRLKRMAEKTGYEAKVQNALFARSLWAKAPTYLDCGFGFASAFLIVGMAGMMMNGYALMHLLATICI